MSTVPAQQRPAAPEPAWHALSAAEVVQHLGTSAESGLTAAEARARLHRYGPNLLREERVRGWPQMLADQFRDVVIWVLLVAILLALLLGEYLDAAVISAIVLLNATMGVVQESKAERSLAALRALASPHALVVREGVAEDHLAADLVPGDIVLLEAGNVVPADLRLLEAAGLRVEEAALTGESEPVEKDATARVEAAATAGDRLNVTFAGTTVVAGRGRGVVVATGEATQVGRIARLLGEMTVDRTPLQQRLERMGHWLAALVIAVCLIVFLAGWLRGFEARGLFFTAVSLAVAAIPEGLPAIVTIVLAIGTAAMVRRHVIVRRLSAVEALGSVTVICTDKTGTLTLNQMTVRAFWTDPLAGVVTGEGDGDDGGYHPAPALSGGEPGPRVHPREQPVLVRLLEVAVLCNDATAQPGAQGGTLLRGDPTETALLVAAAKAGLEQGALRERFPRRAEAPFDSTRKRMATVHSLPEGGFRTCVKGAPGEVLARCTHLLTARGPRPLTEHDRARLGEAVRAMGEQALRVLAFAYRDSPQPPPDDRPETLEHDLVLCGYLGMMDPPRPEARDSIAVCRRAGIRPVMITGDYAVTAAAVARELGLAARPEEVVTGAEIATLSPAQLRERAASATVFARVSPEDKLRIVEALQQHGESVAMTGDGVNDAPALKKADIGVAMGASGTDVARSASDIVLTDDNFASIVAAVEEGRRIFTNIRRFVFYLLSCNTSEVLAIFLAIMVGLPQPLFAVQILWVNLVTDGLPALALGMEPGHRGLMERPPRPPREGVLTPATVREVVYHGLFITLATLAAYCHGLYWLCLVPAGYTGWEAVQVAVTQQEFWSREAIQPGLLEARTMAFGTLAFSQLVHALNSRSSRSSLFRLSWRSNPQLLGALVVSSLAQLSVIYLPVFQPLLRTTAVTGQSLLIGMLLGCSPLLFAELRKWVLRTWWPEPTDSSAPPAPIPA